MQLAQSMQVEQLYLADCVLMAVNGVERWCDIVTLEIVGRGGARLTVVPHGDNDPVVLVSQREGWVRAIVAPRQENAGLWAELKPASTGEWTQGR